MTSAWVFVMFLLILKSSIFLKQIFTIGITYAFKVDLYILFRVKYFFEFLLLKYKFNIKWVKKESRVRPTIMQFLA